MPCESCSGAGRQEFSQVDALSITICRSFSDRSLTPNAFPPLALVVRRLNASARRRNSALWETSVPRRFARALIVKLRSLSHRQTPNPNRFAAMAMLSAIPFSPQPLIAIGISLLSTERSRPIRRALLQKTRECCSNQTLSSFNISAVKQEGPKAIQHRSSLQQNNVPYRAAPSARPCCDIGHGSLNHPVKSLVDK